jgi:hypothetical protein
VRENSFLLRRLIFRINLKWSSNITKTHLISDFGIPATSIDADTYLSNMLEGVCPKGPFDGAFEPKKEV